MSKLKILKEGTNSPSMASWYFNPTFINGMKKITMKNRDSYANSF